MAILVRGNGFASTTKPHTTNPRNPTLPAPQNRKPSVSSIWFWPWLFPCGPALEMWRYRMPAIHFALGEL